MIFMKKTGLVPATMLLALCVLGLVPPTSGNGPPPRLTIEPQTVTVNVCSEFTVEIWIRDIPSGWSMVGFDFRVEWDPTAMEYRFHTTNDHGWLYMHDVGAGYLWFTYPIDTGHEITEGDWWASITFHCLHEGTSTIVVTSTDTIWLWDGEQTPFGVDPEFYGATVHQTRAVGGVLTGTDKLAVLSPYLALIGLVGAVTVAVAVRRRKP